MHNIKSLRVVRDCSARESLALFGVLLGIGGGILGGFLFSTTRVFGYAPILHPLKCANCFFDMLISPLFYQTGHYLGVDCLHKITLIIRAREPPNPLSTTPRLTATNSLSSIHSLPSLSPITPTQFSGRRKRYARLRRPDGFSRSA